MKGDSTWRFRSAMFNPAMVSVKTPDKHTEAVRYNSTNHLLMSHMAKGGSRVMFGEESAVLDK